jgi:hypothetical protein
MAKIKSFGAQVYLNGIAIGGLTDINATGTDVSMIDTTSHDAGGGFRTFVSGLKDGGTLELTGKYNYADAGQAEWKAEEGMRHIVMVNLSDNSGLVFYVIVGAFRVENPLDDATAFTATAKITGQVFPVYPSITVTGITSPVASNPVVLTRSADVEQRPAYTNGAGWLCQWDSTSTWNFGLSGEYEAEAENPALSPVGLTFGAPSTGAGTITVTGS